MIISRTPFRVSFFGGGTDYPAWFQEHGGAVLATAIDKYCYLTCRHLPPFFKYRFRVAYSKIETVNSPAQFQHPAVRAVLDEMGYGEDGFDEGGLEIHHDGDLPARSGLGSSSAFTVGLVHALKALRGEMISTEQLAIEAIRLEQNVMKENVGSQDQVTAAVGGFNKVTFLQNGNFTIEPIVVKMDKLKMLEDHLMLFFTGFERFASEVAKSQIENIKNKQTELKTMRCMVDQGIAILNRTDPDVTDFGRLLHEAWVLKRSLSDKVSTPEIDDIYGAARNAGAIGGKILGAGSGGFFLIFAPPELKNKIRERLKHLIHVPIKFEPMGSRIMLYQPNGLR